MRVAVVSEVSARDKNPYILEALKPIDADVFNIGMSSDGGEAELTYIHTGLLAAAALNTGAADFVVGGCGTGQGFLLSVLQYPGVFCGHILTPLDAWLFSQINGGNCVSLALNEGFGWAGDIQLDYIFEKLFADAPGGGYPTHRRESQQASRKMLSEISAATHRSLVEIIHSLDPALVRRAFQHPPFVAFINEYARDGELKDAIVRA